MKTLFFKNIFIMLNKINFKNSFLGLRNYNNSIGYKEWDYIMSQGERITTRKEIKQNPEYEEWDYIMSQGESLYR